MSWQSIGTVLIVLVVVFVVGRLWFTLVEGVLGKLRRFFTRNKKPPVWHTYTDDKKEND